MKAKVINPKHWAVGLIGTVMQQQGTTYTVDIDGVETVFDTEDLDFPSDEDLKDIRAERLRRKNLHLAGTVAVALLFFIGVLLWVS